jgi:hypothetical protein
MCINNSIQSANILCAYISYIEGKKKDSDLGYLRNSAYFLAEILTRKVMVERYELFLL